MGILVLGHGGHGKGTFCQMLSEEFGVLSASSSYAAAPYVFECLNEIMGMVTGGHYLDPSDAYRYRHTCRDLWKELISLYNTPDKTALARLILSNADAYDGMRCAEEYAATRSMFHTVFWVDASQRVPLDSSMYILKTPDMVAIDNNGTEAELRQQVDALRGRFSWT